jgi:flagellar motility protein MotE (MotC chaperone)
MVRQEEDSIVQDILRKEVEIATLQGMLKQLKENTKETNATLTQKKDDLNALINQAKINGLIDDMGNFLK